MGAFYIFKCARVACGSFQRLPQDHLVFRCFLLCPLLRPCRLWRTGLPPLFNFTPQTPDNLFQLISLTFLLSAVAAIGTLYTGRGQCTPPCSSPAIHTPARPHHNRLCRVLRNHLQRCWVCVRKSLQEVTRSLMDQMPGLNRHNHARPCCCRCTRS